MTAGLHSMDHLPNFDLPPEIMAVLPRDPYDQLDIAKKITSIAVSTRVSKLETEVESLKKSLAEKNAIVESLKSSVGELERALDENASRLSNVLDEQGKLFAEKNSLAALVKKLTRDVTKLETFKRTLIHSLEEDEENNMAAYNGKQAAYNALDFTSNRSQSLSIPSNLTSANGSPTSTSASTSPKFRSMVGSPRRQNLLKYPSIGDGRFSLPTSLPASKHSTAPSSPPHIGSHSGKTARSDGKEFFRKARTRLSYEQFSAFLANIKELNAHHQSKEETLKKACSIFGPENEDLYNDFSRLLGRYLPT